ncbi:MAG: hypothetical protein QW062_01785, partial [Thermoplasmatales archaeon]
MIMGIDDNSYIEYENLKEFCNWVLKLKPKDVRDKGISKQTLWNIKQKIRNNKNFRYNSTPIKAIKNFT